MLETGLIVFKMRFIYANRKIYLQVCLLKGLAFSISLPLQVTLFWKHLLYLGLAKRILKLKSVY